VFLRQSCLPVVSWARQLLQKQERPFSFLPDDQSLPLTPATWTQIIPDCPVLPSIILPPNKQFSIPANNILTDLIPLMILVHLVRWRQNTASKWCKLMVTKSEVNITNGKGRAMQQGWHGASQSLQEEMRIVGHQHSPLSYRTLNSAERQALKIACPVLSWGFLSSVESCRSSLRGRESRRIGIQHCVVVTSMR
jgi:hypothetical protein